VRASEVRLVADEFVKDGQVIAFQRVHLLPGARLDTGGPAALQMVALSEKKRAARKGRARRASPGDPVKRPRGRATRAPGASSRRTSRAATDAGNDADSVGSLVETALRSWRSQEAKKRGIPAFRILTDRTLVGIARARPADEDELLAISGIGPALLKK